MQSWTEHSRCGLIKCWVWGKDYIPWQVGIIPNAAWDTNSLVSVKDTILVHGAQLEPQGPYFPSCFPVGCPQLVLVNGAVPLQVQDLAHFLVKLTSGRQQSCIATRFPFLPLSKIFIYIAGGDEPWLLLFCRWCVKLFKLLSLSADLFPSLLLWCSFLLLIPPLVGAAPPWWQTFPTG